MAAILIMSTKLATLSLLMVLKVFQSKGYDVIDSVPIWPEKSIFLRRALGPVH